MTNKKDKIKNVFISVAFHIDMISIGVYWTNKRNNTTTLITFIDLILQDINTYDYFINYKSTGVISAKASNLEELRKAIANTEGQSFNKNEKYYIERVHYYDSYIACSVKKQIQEIFWQWFLDQELVVLPPNVKYHEHE